MKNTICVDVKIKTYTGQSMSVFQDFIFLLPPLYTQMANCLHIYTQRRFSYDSQ